MTKSGLTQTIIDRLSQKDIRLTSQRIEVYRYLLENRVHPTVDDVYGVLKAMHPSLSKTTIYNTVGVLSKVGLVRQIHADSGEVRLDADVSQHGHFVCCVCRKVMDFPLDNDLAISLPDGYVLNGLDISATGLCPLCRR